MVVTEISITFVTSPNKYNMTFAKNQQFENLIDAMMIEEVAGLDSTLKTKLQGLPIDKKRIGILSILDKDRGLFMKIYNKINDNNISKTDYIKHLVEMLREYVKVGDFERKQHGEVQTPVELVQKILNKLPKDVWSNPNLKWLDNSTGTGIFIACIVERLMVGLDIFESDDQRYKYIMENMIYVSELQSKNCFLYLVSFDPKDEYSINIYNGSFLDDKFDNHCNDVWGVDKFDIVVMNPPYNQMLDMAFIKKSHEISDITLCIHPSTWLIDEKNIQKKFTSTKELVKDDLISIELFNGNGVFGISLFVPCVITYINKNQTHTGIKCIDRINGVELVYDNTDDINKFSNVDVYPKLKNKLIELCKDNNLNKIIKTQEDKTYFVNLAQIRGNVKDTNKLGLGMDSDMLVDDFYTMVTKDLEISLESKQQPVSFASEVEARNFLGYIKTNFVRFCLSIYKNNGNLHRGELALTPWLDFTQEWTDKKLYSNFNLSQEEMAFIEKVIPKYY